MLRALALCALIALSGCANVFDALTGRRAAEQFEAHLRQWHGKSEAELTAHWGAPETAQTEGKRKFFIYEITSAGLSTHDGYGVSLNVDSSRPQSLPLLGDFRSPAAGEALTGPDVLTGRFTCTITFVIEQGKVHGSAYRGSHCRGKP